MALGISSRALKSLDSVTESECNELVRMQYPLLRQQFVDSIEAQKSELEALICRLLDIKTCRITPSEIWQSGSFNLAITVRLPRLQNAYLRLPFPHRIGEATFPGNADEKIRAEAATYIWLREHCPDVPIPTLHAFGLPDGSTFTSLENTCWWQRVWWRCRCLWASLVGRTIPTTHIRQSARHDLPTGFLLISEAPGRCLSYTWLEHFHDRRYRENLFRGLVRIALSMNAIPQPRLGSFALQPGNETIGLTNRPLSMYMHMLENDGISSGIPRKRTYAEVDSYLSDLLSLQDRQLREQPNSVIDEKDGQRQMAALASMRAVMHHFINPDTRAGPFYLTLSDLSLNNIFVDEDWNVTAVIDLEWAHTLPSQMQTPPYWLTSKSIDGLGDPADRKEYDAVLEEYLSIYEEEEKRRGGPSRRADMQRQTWRSGGFWYFKAATMPKPMYNLFNWHVQPLYNEEHPDLLIFDQVFHWYWGIQAAEFIKTKLDERETYIQDVTKTHAALTEELHGGRIHRTTT